MIQFRNISIQNLVSDFIAISAKIETVKINVHHVFKSFSVVFLK